MVKVIAFKEKRFVTGFGQSVHQAVAKVQACAMPASFAELREGIQSRSS